MMRVTLPPLRKARIKLYRYHHPLKYRLIQGSIVLGYELSDSHASYTQIPKVNQ